MPINDLIAAFAENLLPILLLGAAGFVIGRLLSVDSRSFGRVIFYLFSPLLVFDLLLHTELSLGEGLLTMGFALLTTLTVGLLAFVGALALRLERPVRMAVLLTALFGNTGNYGLPLVAFAFGEQALAHAGLYFVTSAILFNTVGVLIASLGHLDFRQAALGLLKVPTVYGVVLAAALNYLDVELSASFARAVALAADGAIPLMLVLLGLELTRVQWNNSLRAVGLSVFMRLAIGPLAGWLLSIPFGLQGAARQGNIVEASMPAAVTTTVLASEYRLEPALVTAIVFVSTLLSPLTLTPLLVFLGR